jgi:hypothetical protein
MEGEVLDQRFTRAMFAVTDDTAPDLKKGDITTAAASRPRRLGES